MSFASDRLHRAGGALWGIIAQYRAALGERNVALLLGAGFISEIGDWFNIVALISLSYHIGNGAFGVGGMLAIRMLTKLIVQGPAGTFVDRHGGRRLLFASQLLMALIASAFALLIMVPQLWLLYVLVVLLDAANCIARPAFMVELKAAAPPDQRAAANGALFASMTTAQLIGPLLGALALTLLGAAAVFALNGATFLGVALAVAQLRGGLHAAGNDAAQQEEAGAHADAAAQPDAMGYRWLLRRKDLTLYALACLSLALLVQATITLFVVRANTLGLGDGGIGSFYAAVAIGSILGSIVAGSRPQHAAPLYPAAIAMGLCATALAAFGSAGNSLLAMFVLILAGFATDFYEVVGLTYFQHAIPDVLYGRFFSVFLMALSAGGLVGALSGPALEQTLHAGGALAALAAPGLTLALVLAVMSRIWQSSQRGSGA